MTKTAKIGNLIIGGGNKIAVQSMTNLPVTDVEGTILQIDKLVSAGCDVVRIAVSDEQSAKCFGIVKSMRPSVPLVADIHFDARLAILAMECGADKIRINPGNVSTNDLLDVIDSAKKHGTAIRIGVNSGSVSSEFLQKYGDKTVALYESLRSYVEFFEQNGFTNLVLSLKSSDVCETIKLNRMASKLGYPLHVGVTEAGLAEQGFVKNAIGIGALLADGIGDTIRVSLTADHVEEVLSAHRILKALGRDGGVQFVSCPKCGRCKIDLENVAQKVYEKVKNLQKNVKIAVMGCEVNGPGECADADLGLAGGNGKFVIFKKGKAVRTVDESVAVDEFVKEVEQFTNDSGPTQN